MTVFWAPPQVVVIVVIAYAIVQEDKPETESLITRNEIMVVVRHSTVIYPEFSFLGGFHKIWLRGS
jgi:hypothetical protein